MASTHTSIQPIILGPLSQDSQLVNLNIFRKNHIYDWNIILLIIIIMRTSFNFANKQFHENYTFKKSLHITA